MTPEQWSRVKDIFNSALEQEPEQRVAFVAEASEGDDSVRAEVERLLHAHLQSGRFIEHPAASTLLSGRVIGHYEIGQLIGSGGMGHVYAAHDTELGREVALKVASFDGEDAQARLRREAQHASRLSHPHICQIYDVGRADGQLFVVMELVPGRLLADVVRDGSLATADARQYGIEIADALAHAHEHGVTHRDLKSTNVMITPKRGAKVLDFGLARTLDSHQIDALTQSQRSLTGEGMIAGTLPYLAPELLRGQRGDERSDIWAFGVLLYEMVAGGRRPFTGETGFEVSAAILHQPPPALPGSVPAAMRAIVRKCLEKNPGDRYQRAADVQLAFEAMEKDAAEPYESTGDLVRDPKSILEVGSRETAPGPVRARSTSRRVVLMAVAVTLIAAVASAAWWWRSRSVAGAAAGREQRPLVVVRPFTSLSPDPKESYFAAGMTEEIHGQLSQVASLRLLSRNGLDDYKNDVARAVRDLGVRNFVDGSIRVEGNRVRVNAELVDASTRQTVWSNQYDRELADVLAVQSDIAQQIARSLHASLSPREQTRLAHRPTQHLDAYRLVLQANEMNTFDRAQTLEAIGLLRKALEIDPAYAQAQAQIAYRLTFLGQLDDPAHLDRAVAEAQAALRIDPQMPQAHFTLASVYMHLGREAAARQAFLRTLELNPNHTSAMFNFSVLEVWFGRFDEATYWGRRGFGLSGKRANDFYHLLGPLLSIRADVEARRWLEEAERRFPTFVRLQMLLAQLELLEGQADKAVLRTKEALARNPRNEEVRVHLADMAFLADAPDLESYIEPLMERSAATSITVAETIRLRYAYVLARRGELAKAAAQGAEAEKVARDRIAAGNQGPGLKIELAAAAVLRKDRQTALDWLERAVEGGYREYAQIERDPILAELLSEPRYRQAIDRMRRDVDAQRARAGERGLLDVTNLFEPIK